MFSYDVRGLFDSKNENDDGDDDDVMMSPQEFITCCKMWTAVQDGWFYHVHRHLSLDVDSFWSRLKNSHQCTRLCQRSNQKGNSQVLGMREDKTLTFGK